MSHSPSYIANIRQDYSLAALDEQVAGNEPVAFFKKWFDEALASQIPDVNAMTLASADVHGNPHARIVLLKGIEHNSFTFFTNYDSAKGHELAARPAVALLFFWKELERQVRVEGLCSKIAESESDLYFHSRPAGSQIGAWASPQSQVIEGRHIIEANYTHFEAKFSGVQMPRPPHWGGYSVNPSRIEFWQGRSNRLHDRILFTLNEDGTWGKSRLAP